MRATIAFLAGLALSATPSLNADDVAWVKMARAREAASGACVPDWDGYPWNSPNCGFTIPPAVRAQQLERERRYAADRAIYEKRLLDGGKGWPNPWELTPVETITMHGPVWTDGGALLIDGGGGWE